MIESPAATDEQVETPDWWSDVQDDRAALGGVESWLDEEIDFAPRPRRFARAVEVDFDTAPAAPARRSPRSPSESRVLEALVELGDDVELVSEPARAKAGAFDVILGEDGTLTTTEALVPADVAVEELALTVPPAAQRPTVRITGHPELSRADRALRRRDRSLMELIGPQPDRIAFWVVVLGMMLIVLSRLSA